MKSLKLLLRSIPVLLMGMIVFSSCIKDMDDIPCFDEAGEMTMKFSITTPGATPVEARSTTVGTANENRINSLYIFVFNESSGVLVKNFNYTQSELEAAASAQNVQYELEESLSITAGTTYTVMAIANYTGSMPTLVPETTTRTQIVTAINTVANTSKWNISASSTIPMWGEIDVAMTAATTGVTIPVRRMLARVDVSVVGSALQGVFKLDNVRFYNYNTRGLIVPDKSSFAGSSYAGAYLTPSIPSSSGKQTGALAAYNANAAKTEVPSFYVFENAHVAPYPTTGWLTNPCLIVQGSFDGGAASYYRLDFVKRGAPDQWLSVLRNHRYIFNITSVTGPGHGSLDDALSGPPSNITVDVLPWDDSYKDVVINGPQYMGVKPGDLTFTATGTPSQNITLRTNVAWSVTKPEWINLAGIISGSTSTTEYASGKTIGTTATTNTGAARTGTIVFTNGTMSVSVDVTQEAGAVSNFLSVSPSTVSQFAATGASQPFSISSNTSWTVSLHNTNGSSLTGNWFSLSGSTSGTGDDSRTLTVAENATGQPARSGILRFTAGSIVVNVAISQAAGASGGGGVEVSNFATFSHTANPLYPSASAISFNVTASAPWRVKSISSPSEFNFSNLTAGITTGSNLTVNGTALSVTSPQIVTIVFECTTPNTGYIGGDVALIDGEYKPTNTYTVSFTIGGYVIVDTHRGWAGSNIYWSGTDENDPTGYFTFDLEQTGKQGIFFKYGSLIGLAPTGMGTGQTTVIYPTLSKYVPVEAQGVMGSVDRWQNVPSFTQNISGTLGNSNRHLLIEHHNPAAGIGDICKYISDKGNTPDKGRWRMPTKAEVELITWNYAIYGSEWDQADGNVGTNNMVNGQSVHGVGLKSSNGVLDIPAAGYAQPSGTVTMVGRFGGLYSATPDGSASFVCVTTYNVGNNPIINRNPQGKSYVMPIRCVRE